MYQVQEYLFGWYNLNDGKFNTLEEAKRFLLNRERKRVKSNKRIKKQDFNMHGHSAESKYPTRIINN